MFPTGDITDSTGEQTIHYHYDAYSGRLQDKQFGYNPSDSSYVYADSYDYNFKGQVDSIHRPDERTEDFTYDQSGRLHDIITHDESGTDTQGQAFDVQTNYDNLGRVASQGENVTQDFYDYGTAGPVRTVQLSPPATTSRMTR